MNLIKRPVFAMALTALALGLNGCSKSSSDTSSSSSAVRITGVINAVSSSHKVSVVPEDKIVAYSVSLSTYTITCATVNPPVQTASVALNSDGTFSINIPGAINQPMSCHMVDSNGDNVGDFIISDGVGKDLNGNDQVSNTMALSDNANIGTVNYDPDAQEVTIPKANVASVIADTQLAASAVFDPTGVWTINEVDFTRPPGVSNVCPSGSTSCNGPPGGQTIYLKLWSGQLANSSPIYGLQVWDSFAGYQTCGSMIGLPSAVKTSIGVTFPNHTASDFDFTFSTTVNGFTDLANMNALTNVNLTDFWKMDNATLDREVSTSCGPTNITINSVSYSNAWKCGPDLASMSQISLGGGCYNDATSALVNVSDWSGFVSGGSTTDTFGITTATNTGTVGGAAVTCTNKFAIVNGANVIQNPGTFNRGDLVQQPAGTLCSAMPNTSDQEKIARLQCYADYRHRSGMDRESNSCLPRVNTDWSQTDPLLFATVDFRPDQLVFFDQYQPTPDGKGGSILTRRERFDGVQLDGNSWVNCRVIETGGLSFKRIDNNKLLAIYQSSRVSTSTSKPACMAEFNGRRETFMFYLEK